MQRSRKNNWYVSIFIVLHTGIFVFLYNLSYIIDTEGLDDTVRPGANSTRGRSTKFCMLKQNGDYADLYYCNVYHNCHGGFDTIQYCSSGLVSYIINSIIDM